MQPAYSSISIDEWMNHFKLIMNERCHDEGRQSAPRNGISLSIHLYSIL